MENGLAGLLRECRILPENYIRSTFGGTQGPDTTNGTAIYAAPLTPKTTPMYTIVYIDGIHGVSGRETRKMKRAGEYFE